MKLLYTDGKGSFTETDWVKPEPTKNQIVVKSIMTGVCRSDIDMMEGKFTLPDPIAMSGHEGLGQVVEVGDWVRGVNVDDYVATRGEPAYADFYNVRDKEFVIVPEAQPKYIIEPVACGINIVMQPIKQISSRCQPGNKILILGSGLLAWVAYNTLLFKFGQQFEIDVVGNHNKDIWDNKLISDIGSRTYDIVIDLSSGSLVFDKVIYNNNALIIMGAQKMITTDFAGMLWKAVTMSFPSPRNEKFIDCMLQGVTWIRNGELVVDKFWTKGYNRNTEWQQAFEDGINRPANYNRGYIYWD